MIECQNLTKQYGNQKIIENFTFSYSSSVRYALLGKNGAGKSTLLHLIAGVLRPTKGKVNLHKNKLYLLGHDLMLYQSMSVSENLQYFKNLSASNQSIKDALTDAGIYAARHKKISSLSQGMKQRLIMARARLFDSDFMLLDEPFSALDIKGQQSMKELLFSNQIKAQGYILVEHDISRAYELCEEFIVLKSPTSWLHFTKTQTSEKKLTTELYES